MVPEGAKTSAVRVPDPMSVGGATDVTIVDVAADGYRLRLVDHPAAFDRDAFYGDNDQWKGMVLGQTRVVLLQAVQGLKLAG